MSGWGTTTSDESRPKFLTAEEKEGCYATTRGWCITNSDGLEEVIVAIGDLTGSNTTTGLGAPTVLEVDLESRSANDDPVTFTVIYNEVVIVDTSGGTPYIQLGGTYAGGDGRADYTSGNNSNQLVFTYTPVSSDNETSVTFPDTVTLNSGTITDASNTSMNAGVDFTAAGTDNSTDVKPDVSAVNIIKA